MAGEQVDSVVLIHGTFAASGDDAGPQWWQRDSGFARWLERRLGGAAECRDVFHWSGENRERERQRAGRLLLEKLRAYEKEGRRYHLVGHSHGGSVIWAALRGAARRGEALPHLRSWSTVGTPFLSYRLRLGDLLLAIPLAVAALAAVAHLGQFGVATRHAAEMRAAGDRLTTPMLWGFWLMTAACLLYCAFRVGAVGWAALHLRRERRAGTRAIDAFGGRWLGLWSGEDEAINGLRSTLGLDSLTYRGKPLNVLPRTPLPIFAGLGDRLFFEWLKRFLQGNDRISQSLCEVAPTPRTADAFIAAPLTVEDNEALIARVAHGVSLPRTLNRLRRVIGQVAFGGALQSPFEPEDGETAPVFNSLLVHTVYFPEADDGDALPIPRRIAEFIAGRAGPDPAAARSPAAVVATPAGDGHEVAAAVHAGGPIEATTQAAKAGGPAADDSSGPWSRFYSSTAVQRTLVYALTAAALISWAGSTAVFDQVRRLTPEARVSGLIAGAPEIDAAEDAGPNPALTAWTLALYEAQSRGAGLRVTPAGPLGLVGLPSVPGVTVPPGRPEQALAHIENPLRLGEACIAVAEALAKDGPSRHAWVATLADRAAGSIARVAPRRDDAPPSPTDAGPSRFPPDPAGYAANAVRLVKLRRGLGGGEREKALKGAEEVVRVAQAEVDDLKKGVRFADEKPEPPSPPGFTEPSPPRDVEVRPQAPEAEDKPRVPAPQAPVEQRPIATRPLPGNSPDAGEPGAEGRVAPAAELVVPHEVATVTPDREFQRWSQAYRTGLNADDTARMIDALLDALDELKAMSRGKQAGEAAVEFLASIRDIRSIELSKGDLLDAEVRLLHLTVAQAARLAVLIRGLDLEGKHPEALHFARSRLRGESSGSIVEIEDVEKARADLAALGLHEPLIHAADRWLERHLGRDSNKTVAPEALTHLARLYAKLGRPDHAAAAARGVLDAFRMIRPSKRLLEETRMITHEAIKARKQKEVDAYACRRVRLLCFLTRAGLGGTPDGPGDATSLLDAAWAEAMEVAGHSSETSVDADFADPTARVVAAAADLEGPAAAGARRAISGRFLAAVAASSRLRALGAYAPELGRSLRLLSAALLDQGDRDGALALADAIPRTADRIAARIVVADRLAHGDAASRAEAARMLAEDWPAIEREVPYRVDRSPLMAGAAVVWARLGETNRGVAASEGCMAGDRLRADDALLQLFATPPGAEPAFPVAQPAEASRTPISGPEPPADADPQAEWGEAPR